VEYSESLEQSSEFAKTALAKMKELKIPSNPDNFAVWYQYCTGNFPDLARTLDVLIDNNQEFTDVRNAELYEKFFSFNKETSTLNETTHKIREELEKIMEYLFEAGDGTAAYGKALHDITGEIEKSKSSGDLEAAISHVLSATQSMEQQTHVLEESLSESHQEVDKLKVDLENMRIEAMTDGLTGISNRKLFDMELRRAAMEAMEVGTDLCLLMIDIDFFKKFNDTYGHQVGDQVLKLLGATLTAGIKGKDTAARYGGEEFGVILPNTSLVDALKVAETIRRAVSSKVVINRITNKEMGKISVSIGVDKFEYGEPLSRLISHADDALYLAKRQGRDQVVSYDDVKRSELSFER
jgi:diguanylate cyclase